jgi:hypothetical protein
VSAARSAAGFSLGAPFYRKTGSNTGSGPGDSLRQVPGDGPQADGDAAPARPDSELLANSLARLEPAAGRMMAYSFATLFVRHPELRPMFPLALDAHRPRVFAALARHASMADRHSAAGAPDGGGRLRLPVRAVPGGLVSTVLVDQTAAGDTLILGPARGEMSAAAMADPGGDVACFAGGTGLAPVKALVEELSGGRSPRSAASILLFVGARREADLYDLPDLRRLAAAWPAADGHPGGLGRARLRRNARHAGRRGAAVP